MREQACWLYSEPGQFHGADGMAERAVYTRLGRRHVCHGTAALGGEDIRLNCQPRWPRLLLGQDAHLRRG